MASKFSGTGILKSFMFPCESFFIATIKLFIFLEIRHAFESLTVCGNLKFVCKKIVIDLPLGISCLVKQFVNKCSFHYA